MPCGQPQQPAKDGEKTKCEGLEMENAERNEKRTPESLAHQLADAKKKHNPHKSTIAPKSWTLTVFKSGRSSATKV